MNRTFRTLLIMAILVASAQGSAFAAADFVVSSITLLPAAPTASSPFRAQIVVSNIGTTTGDAGYLAYNVNYVTPITRPSCINPPPLKPPLGWKLATVGSVCGGFLCGSKLGTKKTITVDLTAGSAGIKTFAAVADATCKTTEADEKNNYKTLRYTVAPAAGPDFVVQSIALDPATPAADGTFAATVTVKNQGTAAGDGGALDVWLDSTSTPGCGEPGEYQQSVGPLDPGATVALEFLDLPAGAAGDRTFRAFADSQCAVAEANEGNNQGVLSYTVGGGPPATGTDFIVQSIALDPPSPAEYGTFTATVTVKNQGTVAGDGGSLDVWTDLPEPVPGCGELGEYQQMVGPLDPGATATLTFSDLVAGEAGARTFRAFVDSQCGVTEPDETNNHAVSGYAVGGGGGLLPAAFGKLSPSQGVAEQPVAVTLVWEASNGAESYEYCLDTSDDEECDGGNWVSTGTERVAIVPGLSGSTRYFWQARALNAAGLMEADADAWWSFATQRAVPVFKDAFAHRGVLLDPDWATLSGLWILESGAYRASSASFVNLVRVKRFDPERKPFGGGVIQAKLKLARVDGSLANVMLVFDLLDKARYRYVRLAPGSVQIGQVGRYGGVVAGVRKPFVRPLLHELWYTLKVYVYPSGLVKVRLNNARIGEYKFKTRVPGGVGLAAVKARSFADNYYLWGNAALP